MTERDILFYLASNVNLHCYRALIKKLYQNEVTLEKLLTDNVQDFGFESEDLERINQLKEEIKCPNFQDVSKELFFKDVSFLSYIDVNYPERLKAIEDPPIGVFYKGKINILNSKKTIAIVGTRKATSYGLVITKKIACMLSELDFVIVSGLATGIDSSAHEGSLSLGKTIVVLGNSIDSIYPSSNKELAKIILNNGGVIISEYPPKIQTQPWFFPQRNRLISALSDAVIVVEGDTQSGAIITAKFAIKHSKPLFAIPGPINSPTSNGPNALIKSGVAKLLTSVNDVIDELRDKQQKIFCSFSESNKKVDLAGNEEVVFQLVSSCPTSFDALLKHSSLDYTELSQCLSLLEIKGYIERAPEGGFIRA